MYTGFDFKPWRFLLYFGGIMSNFLELNSPVHSYNKILTGMKQLVAMEPNPVIDSIMYIASFQQ